MRLVKKVGDKLDYIKHHGIIGQKWGVRRYQNADGTLTEAGKKKIRRTYEKTFDSYDKYRRTKKRVYAVDQNGHNRYDDNERGYFDPNGGFLVRNRKLEKKAASASNNLKDLESALKKEFGSVKISGDGFNMTTGKAAVNVMIEKNGNKSVVEFAKDYGVFVTPTEFATYKGYGKK